MSVDGRKLWILSQQPLRYADGILTRAEVIGRELIAQVLEIHSHGIYDMTEKGRSTTQGVKTAWRSEMLGARNFMLWELAGLNHSFWHHPRLTACLPNPYAAP